MSSSEDLKPLCSQVWLDNGHFESLGIHLEIKCDEDMQLKAESLEDPIYTFYERGSRNVIQLDSAESSVHMNIAGIKNEIVAEKIEEEELIIKSEHGDTSDEDMVNTKVEKLARSFDDQSNSARDRHKHTLVHNGSFKMFKCYKCKYQSKIKGDLNRHMLVHKDPSQVQMFKCNECSFESKHKQNLTQHILVHKDPYSVPMFKCEACNYQCKHKPNLEKHMLVHKDPSRVQMFKCNECSFASKYKNSLEQHLLIHEDPSQVQMFRCSECSYESKRKRTLERHMLVHRDSSQVQMFRCNECTYQSKHKCNLKQHMFKQHMLVLKSLSKV